MVASVHWHHWAPFASHTEYWALFCLRDTPLTLNTLNAFVGVWLPIAGQVTMTDLLTVNKGAFVGVWLPIAGQVTMTDLLTVNYSVLKRSVATDNQLALLAEYTRLTKKKKRPGVTMTVTVIQVPLPWHHCDHRRPGASQVVRQSP